jgi:hypothetical protein
MEIEYKKCIQKLEHLISSGEDIKKINYEIDSILKYFNNNLEVQNALMYYISKYKLKHHYYINYKDNKHKKIVLITQYFIAKEPRRQHELITCLTNNILNPYIDEIFLLTESFIDFRKHLEVKLEYKYLQKVRQSVIKKRLTLYEAIENATKDDTYYIIANSDIFFTESLLNLKVMDMDNKVFALSRFDLINKYNYNGQNEVKIFTHDGPYGDPVIDSHDAWIINKMSNDKRLDVPLGTCGIDNIANYIFMEHGYEVINPVFSINIIHYHHDNYRNDTVRGMRNNSGNIVETDYTKLNVPYKFIQQQQLEVIHNIESICTLCTNMAYYKDLVFLLNSIQQYEPDIKIYILCDTFVYNKVLKDFPTLDITIKNTLDVYSDMNRSQMEQKPGNLFKDLCFEKINCIEFALKNCNNTLYLDADIILLDKLELKIPFNFKTALCPHFIFKENTDLYGYYNAGMMFITDKTVCDTWRNCKETTRFLDQSCLEDIAKLHTTFELNFNYNFGWWRLFQCENPQERFNKFMVCQNTGKLLYDYKPLRCVHTHLYEENDEQTKQFNNLILELIKDNDNYKWLYDTLNKINVKEDKDLFELVNEFDNKKKILDGKVEKVKEKLKEVKKELRTSGEITDIVYIPRQPRNDKYNHNNDTFRELVKLWEGNNLVKIEEYDGNQVFMNDVLLYDRPTLDWLEDNYKIGLFGNPDIPKNGKLNSSWIFWGRHPKILNELMIHNSFDERFINSIFIGNIENNIQQQYRGDEWRGYINFFELTNNLDGKYKYTHQDYLKLLSVSKFGLCLRGFGPKCNREIEYLAMGVIPLITDGVSLEYYNKLIEGVHYIKINKPEDILQLSNISKENWTIMSNNCIQWYNENCSPNGSYNITKTIIDNLKEQERLEQERLEQERLEQERLEQERLEQERLEQETIKNIDVVNEGMQNKFKRKYPKSLDDIEIVLDIHNKKHTPIDWNNNCDFDRVKEMKIENIQNCKYIIGGEYSNKDVIGMSIEKINNIDKRTIVFNFVQNWGYGYFHYICEILPRILFYMKHKELFKDKNKVFLLHFNDKFIYESLQLLDDLGNTQIVPYNEHIIYDVKDIGCYLVTPTVCGNPSEEGIRLIKEYYLNKIVPFDECCVIIKRKEMDRSLDNFDIVYNYIQSVFPNEKWVVFENLSIHETRYLFNNAKLVIGSHGAGLSNMVFMNENTYVLEFIPADNFNCCYWHLANLMKLNYMMMPIHNYEGNGSFKVNLRQLEKYITYIYEKINF